MFPSEPVERARPALCVINFNGSSYLPSTLARVRALEEQFSEIVLVDDASTDDSVELARNLLGVERVVPLSENRGPGAARNAGLEQLGSDRVLFMDNDVELETQALERLSRALDANDRAVIAMPRIVSAEAPERIEYEGGQAHYSGLLALRGAGSASIEQPSEPCPVGSLVSCCFLFDRARWHDGPPFDESLLMYLEDHELGLRARMLGFDLLAVPAAIGHHGQGTPGLSIRATGTHAGRRVVGTIHNRWYILLKLYQARTLVLLAPYLVAFELFQLAGAVALGWGRPWLSAVRQLIGSLPRVLASRAGFRTLRRLPDGAVLSGGPHPFNPALRSRKIVGMALGALDSLGAANWALTRRLSGGGTVG